jgi:hypothetical protein
MDLSGIIHYNTFSVSPSIINQNEKKRAVPLSLLWPCPQILRPEWKGLPRANPLAYWALSSATKEKSFITLAPGRLGDGGADGRAARQEDDLLRVVVEKVVHDGGTSSGIALKKKL